MATGKAGGGRDVLRDIAVSPAGGRHAIAPIHEVVARIRHSRDGRAIGACINCLAGRAREDSVQSGAVIQGVGLDCSDIDCQLRCGAVIGVACLVGSEAACAPPIKLATLPLTVHTVGVVLAKVTGLPEAPPVAAELAVAANHAARGRCGKSSDSLSGLGHAVAERRRGTDGIIKVAAKNRTVAVTASGRVADGGQVAIPLLTVCAAQPLMAAPPALKETVPV